MGGGTGTGGVSGSGELRQYATCNLSMAKYFVRDVEKGLVKALEKAGLRKKLFKNTFSGKGVEVRVENYVGVISRMKVDMYIDGQKGAEEVKKAIIGEIENQKMISDVRFNEYQA